MNWIYAFLEKIQVFIENNIWIAPIFSILLPFIEAIIPSIPLTAIIALNISVLSVAYGVIPGTVLAILLSTTGSFLGMLLIFYIIRKTLSKKFITKVNKNKIGKDFIEIVETGNNGLILTILSNPLLPSSILNYAISLTNIKLKKYIFVTLTSRLIIVLFLVFLGTIFDTQTHPINFLWVMLSYVIIVFVYGYVIKIRNKKRAM